MVDFVDPVWIRIRLDPKSLGPVGSGSDWGPDLFWDPDLAGSYSVGIETFPTITLNMRGFLGVNI